jgi:hypothetical protein
VKLVTIWNSKAAWAALSALKKPPKLAYRLHKYEKLVSAELDVCEKERDRLIYEGAGKVMTPGVVEHVELKDGTAEFKEFVAKFNEFCVGTESDLPWSGIKMDDLIDALEAERGNVLSEDELEKLEPFFTEPPPKEGSLSVVK